MLPDRNSDLGPSLRATTSVLVPIVTMLITMRIWMRYSKHQLAREDEDPKALITFSWISFTVMCVAGVTATAYGFGKRSELVTISELPMMRLYSGIVASVPWSLSITSAKASFAVLYLRILQPTGGSWVRPLNISVLIFLACQATEEILVVLLQCQPFAKAYDDSLDGSCYSLEPMWIVCLVSIGRLFAVLGIREDTSYETALAVILCQVEIACIIICSCVPALNQFIRSIGCPGFAVNSTRNSYSLPRFYARSGQWHRRRSSTVNDVVHREGAEARGMEGEDGQHPGRLWRQGQQRRRQEEDDQNQNQGERREKKPWGLRYCWKVISNASETIASSAPTGGGGTASLTLTPESGMEELGLEMSPLEDVRITQEMTRRFVSRDGVEMWHQPGSIERTSTHSSTSSQDGANQAGTGGVREAAGEEGPESRLDTTRGLTVNIPTWLDRVSDQDIDFYLQSSQDGQYGEDSNPGEAGEKTGLGARDSANGGEDVDDGKDTDEKGDEVDDDWISAAEHRSAEGTDGWQTPRPELDPGTSEIDMTSHEKGD
ncbi:hypothetical protein MCOR25_004928 [Pyricularia grisea]|nr:hypothetical protein MCOR25_004928 [Pyricularia grisea]